jgi:hypothetical protein
MNKFAKSLALAVLVVVSFGVSSQSASAVACPAYGEEVVGNGQPSNPYCSEVHTDSNGNQSSRLTQDVFYYWWSDGIRLSTRCSLSGNSCSTENAPLNAVAVTSTTTVPSSGGSVTTTVPSSGGSVTTTVPSSGGGSSNSVVRTTTTTIEVPVVEDDGESEDDFADVGLSSKDGKFNIRVSSSFGETEMVLRAYKKNSKSVTWSFTTYSSGSYRILTSRALKGFTVSLWIDGEKWDSLVVR